MSRGFSLRDYLRTAAALPNGLRAEQSATNGVDHQTPLRAELFSADQMELFRTRGGASLPAIATACVGQDGRLDPPTPGLQGAVWSKRVTCGGLLL